MHARKVKLLEAEATIAKLRKEFGIQQEQTNKVIDNSIFGDILHFLHFLTIGSRYFQLLEEERQLWRNKITSLESEYRNKTIVLESELQKQRARVTAIIEEKEKQMVDMQHHYLPAFQLSEDLSSTDV